MVSTQPNPNPGEPGIEALAAGWQELARQLRFLELRGTPVSLEQASRLRALIQRSAESIRAIASGLSGAGLELQQPATARATAMRMAGGGSGPDSLRPFDGLDQAPGRGYQLLMSGTGSVLPAQDVVRLLAARRQVGVLKLRTPREIFTLELERGEIAHMHTNLPVDGERLGEILVRRGVLGQQQLDGIRARNKRGRTGEMLLVGKHVAQRQLLAALETQVHLLIGRLCQAQAENFSFWSGPLVLATPRQRIAVSSVMLAPFQDEGPEPLRSRHAAG